MTVAVSTLVNLVGMPDKTKPEFSFKQLSPSLPWISSSGRPQFLMMPHKKESLQIALNIVLSEQTELTEVYESTPPGPTKVCPSLGRDGHAVGHQPNGSTNS